MGTASTSGVGQVLMAVDDVDRQVDFYVDQLGLALLFRVPGTDMAFFDAGAFRLYVDRWYEGAPVSRPVLYFTVPSVPEAHDALVAAGVVEADPPGGSAPRGQSHGRLGTVDVVPPRSGGDAVRLDGRGSDRQLADESQGETMRSRAKLDRCGGGDRGRADDERVLERQSVDCIEHRAGDHNSARDLAHPRHERRRGGCAGDRRRCPSTERAPATEVTVVAPATNQSGTGGQTTPGPLTVTDATTASGYPAKAVAGFPADTVIWALDQGGVTQKPDLVVSGINFGQNLGPAVAISGTVGAAEAGGGSRRSSAGREPGNRRPAELSRRRRRGVVLAPAPSQRGARGNAAGSGDQPQRTDLSDGCGSRCCPGTRRSRRRRPQRGRRRL